MKAKIRHNTTVFLEKNIDNPVSCISANQCPEYDTKPSDGEARHLELLRMWGIHLLPLLSDPIWLGVGQIEISNDFLYLKPFNSVQINDSYLIKSEYSMNRINSVK